MMGNEICDKYKKCNIALELCEWKWYQGIHRMQAMNLILEGQAVNLQHKTIVCVSTSTDSQIKVVQQIKK